MKDPNLSAEVRALKQRAEIGIDRGLTQKRNSVPLNRVGSEVQKKSKQIHTYWLFRLHVSSADSAPQPANMANLLQRLQL